VKLVAWIADRFHLTGVTRHPGPYELVGYLALGRRPGFDRRLEPRMVLLAGALAAELSGCRWCIDRTRHDWRTAGIPAHLLHQLGAPTATGLFTGRERAALAFVAAVAGSREIPADIDCVREALSDNELAELTAIVAEHHCLEAIDSNLPVS
jgi:alkylhydroperoxidase family enzyme